MTRIGPFKLVNPPEGQEEIIRAAYKEIDFPWERFATAIAQDPDECILVEWDYTGQGTSGLAYGQSLRIVLSNTGYHLGLSAGFVFAHEVGHLVDSATLRNEDRQAIMDLTHEDKLTYRGDAQGQTFNGTWWPNAHAQDHRERWVSTKDYYYLRHNEAFADLFVQAFAPTLWDGSALDTNQRHVRFVHTTTNLDRVREIVLWKPPPPEPPKPEPQPPKIVPKKEKPLSRDPAIDRAIRDLTIWLERHPRKTLKRRRVLAARKKLRAIKPR